MSTSIQDYNTEGDCEQIWVGQQFLDALQEIFIGMPVDSDSNYINLMNIKRITAQWVKFEDGSSASLTHPD